MDGHPEADLGVYVLGVLPGPQSTSLRLHLETCAACRARVDELEGISELLSAARLVPDPPAGLVETALASLPARRPPPGTRSPAPAGKTVSGDIVLTPPEAPVHRWRLRRIVAISLVTAAVAAGCALVWASEARVADPAFELTPVQPNARAHVRVDGDEAGAALALHATGLAAGDYVAELDGEPAGSFHVTGGSADVDLHAAATTGRFVVLRGTDSSVVLETVLP